MRTIAVIGLGYVGLPLAVNAAKSGYKVYGIDSNLDLVNNINAAKSTIEDVSDVQLSEVIRSGNFIAANNVNNVSNIDVILICVPTPVNSENVPDLSYLTQAITISSLILKAGSLVILESTVAPGTTRNFLIPLVEKKSGIGRDLIHFSYSPERIDPLNKTWGISNTPKLISSYNQESLELTSQFYSKFVKLIVRCNSLEVAETAKLLENTFRLVNISFINEIARFCHALGIDVNEVINVASTKPYGFMAFYPSVGIGGHCIPVDPLYLSDKAKEIGTPIQFIELANQINRSLPKYFAELAEKKIGNLKNKKILVIGIAYKPNVSDTRETPVQALIHELESMGANVSWHDDLVKEWRNQKSVLLSPNFHLAILATPHDYIDLTNIGATPLLDTRGAIR
jgi:UDP-N-acetyl-D-glucosamine dehydrogenase